MKMSVLVVDDQVVARKPTYKRFVGKVAKHVTNFVVEFQFVEDPTALPAMLHENVYDGVVVDAVLTDNWPEQFDLKWALETIGKEIPVALVSSQWDMTNSAQLTYAWKLGNVRTFLHWGDIDEHWRENTRVGSRDCRYAIAQLTGMLAEKRGISLGVELAPDEDLRILHISDLQMGGIGKAEVKALEQEANALAEFVRDEWNNRGPTFVAFTGDIAETGSPEEYAQGRVWLARLCERLELGGLPSERLLLVPGNHDVNVRLAAASRIQVSVRGKGEGQEEMKLSFDDPVVATDLLKLGYLPYQQFSEGVAKAEALGDESVADSMPWVNAKFRHLGVVFYGVNTATPPSPAGEPGRDVDSSALSAIGQRLRELMRDAEEQLLVVGLAHHCPTSAHGDRSVGNPEAFERHLAESRRYRTGLFLHGHIHEHAIRYESEDQIRLVRSCASTLSKGASGRPPNSLRGFNLITLSRSESRVTGMRAEAFGLSKNAFKSQQAKNFELLSDGMFKET